MSALTSHSSIEALALTLYCRHIARRALFLYSDLSDTLATRHRTRFVPRYMVPYPGRAILRCRASRGPLAIGPRSFARIYVLFALFMCTSEQSEAVGNVAMCSIMWRCAGTWRCSRAGGATRCGCTTWQRVRRRRASRPSRSGWRTAPGTGWRSPCPAARPRCSSTATHSTAASSPRPTATSPNLSSRYGSVRGTASILYLRYALDVPSLYITHQSGTVPTLLPKSVTLVIQRRINRHGIFILFILIVFVGYVINGTIHLQGTLQDVRLVSGPHGYLAQCPGLDSECPTCGQFSLLQATVQELTTHIHDLSLKVTSLYNGIRYSEKILTHFCYVFPKTFS